MEPDEMREPGPTPSRRDTIDDERLATLGALAGSIGHQLNNFLAVVIGNAGLLGMDAEEGSSLARLLGQIEETGQNAAELVRQMSMFGAKEHEEPEPVDLRRLIDGMGVLLTSIAGAGQTIDRTLLAPVPAVDGHPRALGYVVLNLVWSAAVALDGRTGTIAIATRSTGTDVVLEVSGTVTGATEAVPGAVRSYAGPGPDAARTSVVGVVHAHGGTLTSDAGEHGQTHTVVVLPAGAS